ncbi:MAG TPA: ATP phosphoribosyltransferase [Jiangellaceae bacterium]|nr:ATP phosphoribosyltransferase [Jiangellaceae bacterium]
MNQLRIAVPNKGGLAEPATEMLHEAGYRQRTDSRDLVLIDEENNVEFYFLRPRDIAVYVASGTLDVGITGRDLVLDSGADVTELLPLGFGESTFRFAARPGVATEVADIAGLRVATSYTGLVEAHLAQRDIDAEVIRLDGAVETSVRLGVADVVADVVSSGTTLRQAGLEIFGETILESEAVVIARDHSSVTPAVEQLLRRIRGVLVARSYVMMDYDIRVEHLEQASQLTPGIESPTVSPLHREGWVAVRAMVLSVEAHQAMDALWDLGARGILVTDIVACRL